MDETKQSFDEGPVLFFPGLAECPQASGLTEQRVGKGGVGVRSRVILPALGLGQKGGRHDLS